MEPCLCFPIRHHDVGQAYLRNRDGSLGIATDWTTGVRFPLGARDFSVLQSVQTGSGLHSASYPMGTEGSFPWDKAVRA
jgi:hypothetical protein